MGENYYKGYSTSDDDQEEMAKANSKDDDKNDKEEEEEAPGKLDKEELSQIMLEDAIQPRSYIISARSPKRFVWDVIIIVFAIINAVTLPLDIAFEKVMG